MGTHPFIDILFDADHHTGNVFGLWHPDYKFRSGGGYTLNDGQQYLWDCWNHLADRLKKAQTIGETNIVAHVHNGDEIDGEQRLQDRMEAVTTDPVDQADCFELIDRDFRARAGIAHTPEYFIQGTEYHIGKGGKDVERIAKSVGAVRYNGLGTGRYCREVLDLDTGYGITINVCHGIGVSSGLYRATAPDREGVWSALAGKLGKMPQAEVVVRAHAHYRVSVDHETKHILILPCWELQTRYMRKHGAYRMLPSIGSTIIRVYKEERLDTDDRVEIKKFKYNLPPYSASKLNSALAARPVVRLGRPPRSTTKHTVD